MLNAGLSPLKDRDIEHYLSEEKLDLTATTDKQKAYAGADFVIVATPTDYDSELNFIFECLL